MADYAENPIKGARRAQDCTVMPMSMIRDRDANRKALEDCIKAHIEYKRVPKGVTKIKHTLPLEESHNAAGEEVSVRPKTVTKRTSN